MTRLFEANPYIIAEIGSNWRTLDDCFESIRVAKDCGADAVKFQAFTPEALYGLHGVGSFEHVMRLDWLPRLRAKADEVGIEFGCTAFSPDLVAAVDPFVHWHKVASSDAAWPQMLEAVAKCGKPVLVSMGAKIPPQEQDIYDHLTTLMDLDLLVQMQCVAAYPADFTDLPSRYGYPHSYDGLSDHTLGYTATVEAARRGAIVIEKHFTAFDMDTPDRPHSLTPKQFKRMVDIIRGRKVESEEIPMYLRHNRRLIATRDISAGEVLKYGENFGSYRSLKDDTRGASPFDWDKVEGRMAKGSIGRGSTIVLRDVE